MCALSTPTEVCSAETCQVVAVPGDHPGTATTSDTPQISCYWIPLPRWLARRTLRSPAPALHVQRALGVDEPLLTWRVGMRSANERAAAPGFCTLKRYVGVASDTTNLVWSRPRSRRAGHLSTGTPTESPSSVTTGRGGGCDARRLNPPSQPWQARSGGCPTSNGPESMPTVTDRHISRGPASLAAQILAGSAARLRQDQSPIRADLAARSGRPRRRTGQPQSSWRLQPRSRSTP